MNTPPTIESVTAKLEQPGALFASDEVAVVLDELAKSDERHTAWVVDIQLAAEAELIEAQQGWENAVAAQLDYINRYHDEFAAREQAEADATRLREALGQIAANGNDEPFDPKRPYYAEVKEIARVALSGGGAANKEQGNTGAESEIRRSGGEQT